MNNPIATVALAGLGGYLGTVVRSGLGLKVSPLGDGPEVAVGLRGLPVSTLIVNCIGTFVLALLARLSKRFAWDPAVLIFIGTGVCGGLTTYSSFAVELLKLFEAGNWPTALSYFTITHVAAGCCAVLGWALAGAG